MTQMQLISHIATFDNFRVVKFRNKLKEQSFTLSELVDLTFLADPKISLKASKILQYIILKSPSNYTNEIAYLLEHVSDVECGPCKRHYARILVHLTSPEIPRAIRDKIKDIEFDHIAELCFKWMRDGKMNTYVRCYASETLFNLRHRYPWIAEALSRDLETIRQKASPLLKSKADFILSYLHPED
jgi:hypothetical protein